jgi:hypothetical protein
MFGMTRVMMEEEGFQGAPFQGKKKDSYSREEGEQSRK